MKNLFLEERQKKFEKYQRLFVISMILFLSFFVSSALTIIFTTPLLIIISVSLMIISGIASILIDRRLNNLID